MKDPEDILLAQNLGSNDLGSAARARQGAALWSQLRNNFLLWVGYEVVSHVDLLESWVVARISLDLGLDLGFYLGFEINHFNYC